MPTTVRRSARGAPPLDPRRVRALGDCMLRELGLMKAELSVLLTNDRGIRELNRVHRGKDRPTDVLSFALDESEVANAGPARLLGDVVISLDTAARQARARHRELFAEVRFLLAHGVLHLVGYDHAERADKRRMDAMTRRLVKAAERLRPSRRDTARSAGSER